MSLVLSEPRRFEPDRFSGAPVYSAWEDAIYARDLEARAKPDGDDLSNELDEDVCNVLLNLLDAGMDESAGKALRIVRDALHRRKIARAWGDKPAADDDTMTALRAGMEGLV